MVSKSYRSAALKTLQMKHKYNEDHFEEVQTEAIIMERLTRSPRIMDIYGHCGEWPRPPSVVNVIWGST